MTVGGVLHVVAGDGLDARVAEAVQPVGKVTRVPGGRDSFLTVNPGTYVLG